MAVYYCCGTERRREASRVALRTVFELLGSSDLSHDTLALRVREDPASPIKSCSQEADGKGLHPPPYVCLGGSSLLQWLSIRA